MCSDLGPILCSSHRHLTCSWPRAWEAQALDGPLSFTHKQSFGPPRPAHREGEGALTTAFSKDSVSLLPNKQASPGTGTGLGGREFRSTKNWQLRKNSFTGNNKKAKEPLPKAKPHLRGGQATPSPTHPLSARPLCRPALGPGPPQVPAQ